MWWVGCGAYVVRVGVGVVGLAENKANSVQLELEAGAELGKTPPLSVGHLCLTNHIIDYIISPKL